MAHHPLPPEKEQGRENSNQTNYVETDLWLCRQVPPFLVTHGEPEELGDAKLSEVRLDEVLREVHGAAEVREEEGVPCAEAVCANVWSFS